jgi:transcriptional regulator with PAS, ATPase and Fis domain
MDQQELQQTKQRFGIIGNAPKLNYAIRNAVLAAPTDISVLITGESGSGKESFSKIIHQLSHRRHGPFIAVNCGAIPVGTIDSELFGHEKGSFTGATDTRKGYFEVTDGGSIFLDEIGEMPLGTQARLLRVLENSEIIKVGSSKVQKTNVRVVAATNVNLMEKVQQGKFREDLYYRLSGVHVVVPPLRERGEDVLLLFRKFAADFSEQYRVKPIVLDEGAQQLLLGYRFPGNIRQLRNLANQLSVLETESRDVSAERLRRYLPEQGSSLPMLLPKGLLGSGHEGENYSDRDLLYKVLFDMRAEVTELKQLVRTLLKASSAGEKQQLMKEHEHLFHNLAGEAEKPLPYLLGAPAGAMPEGGAQPLRSPEAPFAPKIHHPDDEDGEVYEAESIEDIPHREEVESLSLQDQERELIVRALKKNNNKRKYAAQDLGISQRTLYRKIKQYDIDE